MSPTNPLCSLTQNRAPCQERQTHHVALRLQTARCPLADGMGDVRFGRLRPVPQVR